jgi:hypothetical protein
VSVCACHRSAGVNPFVASAERPAFPWYPSTEDAVLDAGIYRPLKAFDADRTVVADFACNPYVLALNGEEDLCGFAFAGGPVAPFLFCPFDLWEVDEVGVAVSHSVPPIGCGTRSTLPVLLVPIRLSASAPRTM